MSDISWALHVLPLFCHPHSLIQARRNIQLYLKHWDPPSHVPHTIVIHLPYVGSSSGTVKMDMLLNNDTYDDSIWSNDFLGLNTFIEFNNDNNYDNTNINTLQALTDKRTENQRTLNALTKQKRYNRTTLFKVNIKPIDITNGQEYPTTPPTTT